MFREMVTKPQIILLGLPGRGKSTLLNSLIGKTTFESGYSEFRGLTEEFTRHETERAIYFDTPGLEDANKEMQKRAAEEVTKALKQRGIYKIFFVITLEAGRVDTRDAALIKVILEHAREITRFGVIVNKEKMSKMIYK